MCVCVCVMWLGSGMLFIILVFWIFLCVSPWRQHSSRPKRPGLTLDGFAQLPMDWSDLAGIQSALASKHVLSFASHTTLRACKRLCSSCCNMYSRSGAFLSEVWHWLQPERCMQLRRPFTRPCISPGTLNRGVSCLNLKCYGTF